MTKSLEQIYNKFAETYDKNRSLFDMTEIFDSFYGTLNHKNGSLLDLGCGAGESFSKLFVDKRWSVTGVDFSEKMVELATKYVPEMTTIHADMRKLVFEPRSFDAISAIYSLFHLPTSDHFALFEHFYRWLTPGGMVLFTYATKEYTGSERFDGEKEFMGQNLYYGHKKPDELYLDLESIGFMVEAADYRTIGGETFLWIICKKH
ncbi:class I SAM-dependent methyltransferase [bacterium]|nr:class I SAM-dependent methyltransferase [bacterium]